MKKNTWALSALFCAAAMLLVPASLQAATFRDVPEDAWYAPYVNEMADQGILNGRGDGTFDPNGNITRAEMVKILASASGEDLDTVEEAPFQDCSNHWAKKYINWAYKTKVVNGKSSTEFAPDDKITRVEITAMVYRYAEYKKIKLTRQEPASCFVDHERIPDWGEEIFYNAKKAGIMSGYPDGTARPLKNTTRAEASKIYMTATTEKPAVIREYCRYYENIFSAGTEFSLQYTKISDQPDKCKIALAAYKTTNETLIFILEEGKYQYIVESKTYQDEAIAKYQIDVDFFLNEITLTITKLSGESRAMQEGTLTFETEDWFSFSYGEMGICGEDLYFTFDTEYPQNKKILHIFGEGPMYDWEKQGKLPPWYRASGPHYIIIDEGSTNISNRAFTFYYDVEEIYLPSSIKKIGYWDFGVAEHVDIYFNGTEAQWDAIDIDKRAFTSEYTDFDIYVLE